MHPTTCDARESSVSRHFGTRVIEEKSLKGNAGRRSYPEVEDKKSNTLLLIILVSGTQGAANGARSGVGIQFPNPKVKPPSPRTGVAESDPFLPL